MQGSILSSNSRYVPFVIMSLAMLVPSPARFACGIVLVIELNILVAAGTYLKPLKIWTLLSDYKTLLMLVALVTIVSIYSLLLGAWSPAIQMQLGFVLYLQAASSFIISTTFSEDEGKDIDKLGNIKQSLVFSGVALITFILRDILGYGTITYPTLSGVHELIILKSRVSAFTLLATIPGGMLCTAFTLVLLALFERGKDILSRAQGEARNTGGINSTSINNANRGDSSDD